MWTKKINRRKIFSKKKKVTWLAIISQIIINVSFTENRIELVRISVIWLDRNG